LELTKELLRSVFLDMFGDPVTNPKGWRRAALASFGTITTGNTPPRARLDYYGADIEWIKSDNINTSSHLLTRAVEGLSNLGRTVGRLAPARSTLITCIAGSPDCIGNVALADRDVAFNQQINSVSPNERTDYRFLYVMLLVGKRLIQAASTNSMKGMVSKTKLESVMFPEPPEDLQSSFGRRFDYILSLEKRIWASFEETDSLFGSLAQQAFRGEL
jgi:type I restriction enzyme S subunit